MRKLLPVSAMALFLASCMPPPTDETAKADDSSAIEERLDVQNERIGRIENQLHEMRLMFSSQLKRIEDVASRPAPETSSTPQQPPQQVVIMPPSPVVTHRWEDQAQAPHSPPAAAAAANPARNAREHLIQPGDTLSEIAEAHGIPVGALMAANPGTDPLRLVIGRRLAIPSVSASSRVHNAIKRSTYTVKPGDTLSEIAEQFGISLKALQVENPGVDPKRLQVGKKLTISHPKVTSSRRAAAPQSAPAYRAPRPSQTLPAKPAKAPVKPAQKLLVRIPRNKSLGEIAEDFRTDIPTLNHLNHCALTATSRIPANSTLYVPAQ